MAIPRERRSDGVQNARRSSALKVAAIMAALLVSMVFLYEAFDSVGTQTIYLSQEEQESTPHILSLRGMDFNLSKYKYELIRYEIDFVVWGNPGTKYVRVTVGERYIDGRWTFDDSKGIPYNGETLPVDSMGYEYSKDIKFNVTLQGIFSRYIPSVFNTISLNNLTSSNLIYGTRTSINGQFFNYHDKQKVFSIKQDLPFQIGYSLSYRNITFDEKVLDNASVVKDPFYLQIPLSLQKNIQFLAEEATQGADSPYRKMLALESYLKSNYKFTLDYTGEGPPDPVQYFLFSDNGGLSLQFNSALVLLARSIGIPARLVGGYLIQSETSYPIQYVWTCQRHVYAEVLFEGIGWIGFDAAGSELELILRPTSRPPTYNPPPDVIFPTTELILLIILILTGAGIVATIIRHQAKKMKKEVDEPEIVEVFEGIMDERLRMEFPQIVAPLPLVWGIDESLDLRVTLRDSNGAPIARTVKISVNDGKDIDLAVDQYGSGITKLVFKKGRYVVKAVFPGDALNERVESKVLLRVVDYRQEIVDLFNQAFKTSGEKILEINDRLTAREFEDLLSKEYPSLSREALERIASVFEVSDYSVHHVGREEYVKFYLAKLELDRLMDDGRKRE